MGLTELQRLSWRFLGPFADVLNFQGPELKDQLQRAHIPVRPEVYATYAWFSAILAEVVGLGLVLLFELVYRPLLGIGLGLLTLPTYLMLGLMGPIVLVLLQYAPEMRARRRREEIDGNLAYALSYIAAMASAGVNVDEIMRSMAQQGDIYGEVADEAAWIYRDVELFGRDVVTALRDGADRSPSQNWEDVLTGAVTVITSGGDLQSYFSAKAEQYMVQNRQDQKQFTETMGLMAETYVTVGVAGPLFLMVMMAIMALVGGGGDTTMLAMIVYLMLPAVNLGFAYGMFASMPEV